VKWEFKGAGFQDKNYSENQLFEAYITQIHHNLLPKRSPEAFRHKVNQMA